MKDHKHVIVLNGRRYNAKTGEHLARPGEPVHVREASHHTPAAKPPPKRIQVTVHKPSRHASPHVKAHSPRPSRTLMRQGLKRPAASTKRRIRVQGHLDSQAKKPDTTVHHKTRSPGHKVQKTHLISHFSPNLFTSVAHVTVVRKQPLVSDRPISTAQPTMKPAYKTPSKKPQTTADLLEYVVRYANKPYEPETPAKHRRSRRQAKRRQHAVAH